MPKDDEPMEIRTFLTMKEVLMLEGYREKNPVNESNYGRIFGDYWFDPKESCCRQKSSGELCNREHNFGFVAKLKDGTVTIIGNCCARDKFDAEASIRKDRSKYINEKRRRDRLAQLNGLLNEKDSVLKRLSEIFEKLKAIQDRTTGFANSLGLKTLRRIYGMAKTGSSNVFIDAVFYHEHKDEDGYIDKERRVVSSRLGTLSGIAIFNEFTFLSVFSQIRDIRNAYKTASEMENDIKTSELESLASTIKQFDAVVRETSSIEAEESAFYANELSLLCYLVGDKSERYKTAQLVLEAKGEIVGKGRAKQWLVDQDMALKEQLKADKIEIQG